jgi:NADPH:quinone reductase-like Zn-dependent oxidoreductase
MTRAFVLTGKGGPEKAFELRKVEMPEPAASQVRIKVEAFGLNYADVMASKGLYRETPPLPAVIGYEVVGTVEKAGSEANVHLIGKRVVGFTRFGGYAQHAVTEAATIAEVDDMPAGEALALATQWVTAIYMVNVSGVNAGEKVLIHAAGGGVGTALIQLCKARGANVIAKIGSRSKEELVRRLGADHVVVYTESDYAQQVAKIAGKIDVSFNPVGGTTFKKDSSLLGTGGRLVLFGGSELSGKFGFFSTIGFLWKMGLVLPIALMMRTRTLIGVNMLRVADDKQPVIEACLKQAVALTRTGAVKPITGGVFSEEQFFEAHRLLGSGKTTGKLAVRWHD